MPIYYFWGDDDFQLQAAVNDLRQNTLAADWASFNYDVIATDQPHDATQGLNQAMTPPFGLGQRLVWLQNTPLGQRCPEDLLAEFERTLPALPETTVLLLTSPTKPDGRAKLTKLLKKYGEIREFTTIPPWKSDLIRQQVAAIAHKQRVSLAPETVDVLAEAVGNDTRQLYLELEKLALYWDQPAQPIPPEVATKLVTVSTQTSLKLAAAIKQADTRTALTLVDDLINRNEPALRIVATLISQFRLWLWIKLMTEIRGQSDADIAAAAEVTNPKRIYFLKQEVRSLTLPALQRSLPLLLELEFGLKSGKDERAALQTTIIELCQGFRA